HRRMPIPPDDRDRVVHEGTRLKILTGLSGCHSADVLFLQSVQERPRTRSHHPSPIGGLERARRLLQLMGRVSRDSRCEHGGIRTAMTATAAYSHRRGCSQEWIFGFSQLVGRVLLYSAMIRYARGGRSLIPAHYW